MVNLTHQGEYLVSLFDQAVTSIVDSGETFVKDYDRFAGIYVKMFKKFPNIIDLDSEGVFLKADSEPTVSAVDELMPLINKKEADGKSSKSDYDIDLMEAELSDEADAADDDDDEEDKYRFKSIDVNKTFIKLIEKYPNAGVIRNYDYPIVIFDKVIVFWNKYQRELTVFQDAPDLYEWIAECVVERDDEDGKRYFEYVTYGSTGFDTVALEVKKQNIDLDMNYNDSLPDKEILAFLNSKESGLAILHGKPGSGKTTYIRHLIYTLEKKDFLVLDSSVFNYITDSSFISLLMEYKNAVIILEDCESILEDRAAGNAKLSALLNLSDGIIGDAFNFKFICTFNARIGKIDKAVLREGRMKVKYEFKSLTADKTKALAEKLGKDIPEGSEMTLAEIYSYGHQNDFSDKDENKIGFKR